jgi:hypothetical protein
MGSRGSKRRPGACSGVVRFREGALAVGISCLALLATAHAADKPDPALLEFLGSVDTEDKDWHDYLAHTDIEQVAKRANNARASPVPAAAPPPVAASTAPKNPPDSAPVPVKPAPVNPP